MIRTRPNPTHRLLAACSGASRGVPALLVAAAFAVAAALAVATALLPTVASAAEGDKPRNGYIEYSAGVSHVPNQTLHGNSASNANLYGRTEQKEAGYFVGVGLGAYLDDYVLEGLRAELQTGYRNSEVQNSALGGESDVLNRDGAVSLLSIMVNAYYDVDLEALAGIESPVTPWVGVGIGWGLPRIDVENSQLRLDDTDSVYVYNVMSGLSMELTPTTSFSLGYRYIATGQIKVGGRYASAENFFSYEFDAHEAFLGLRFSF